MRPYADAIGGAGLLAVVAYTVGQIIAMQDQRVMTTDMVCDLVSENIEAGNQQAIAEVSSTTGQAM